MENLPPHSNHAHHRSAPLTGNLHHCHHPRPTGAIGACLANCHRARPLPPSTSPPLRRSLEPGETHRAAPSLGRGLRRKPCRQPSGPAPSGDLLQRWQASLQNLHCDGNLQNQASVLSRISSLSKN
uniref:Uncharacterized protein n=1 Tax=Oryza nivara TaxID=4536 RepID=A0A0E0FJK5_ORYNI